MSAISDAILSMAGNRSSIKLGIVEKRGTSLTVNVDGAYPPTRWSSTYAPCIGDAVMVQIADGLAWVVMPVDATPRPSEGTVSGAVSQGQVPVTGSDGVLYRCRYAGSAPATGTAVMLLWQSAQPWLLPGTVAATTSPTPTPTVPAPPPPPPSSGTLAVTAVDAASWSAAGGWTTGGPRQGTSEGQAHQGGWWYGSGAAQLRGATVTGCSIRVHRTRGGTSSATPLRVHSITSGPRSGPGIAIANGPAANISLPVGAADWFALPAAWAQGLVDGTVTGFGVSGGEYARYASLGEDAASGQLQIDWRRN